MGKKLQPTGSQSSKSKPPDRDFVRIAREYAREAADSKNSHRFGRWMRLAGQRFLADLKRAAAVNPPFTFDERHACDACEFMEELPHVEGVWDTPTIQLHASDVLFIVQLFGFRNLEGGRRFTTALKVCGRKNAKALALDTPIPTPSGWRTIRDLQAGDEIFESSGTPCKVLATSEVFIGKQSYRVSFSDGSHVVASANHLWETTHRFRPWANPRIAGSGNGGRRVRAVLTTEQIAKSVRVQRSDGGVEYNHSIPVAGALQTSDVSLPLDPYMLGVWLGDGTTQAAQLTCGTEDLSHFVEEVRSVVGGEPIVRHDRTAWRIGLTTGRGHSQPVKVASILRRLGVLGDKHVPESYLWAGTEQRRALLQGLMDTDGSISPTGLSGAVACTFVSTKRELADGVLQLARSLGLKATLGEGVAKLQGRVIGPRYLVQFTAWAEDRVFRLPRKLARLNSRPNQQTRASTLKIVACELVPSVPTKCLMVDSQDCLFLAGPGMVQTHNSTISAGIGLYCQACEDEPGPQVISAATTGSQARIVFNVAKRMVEKTGDLREALHLEAFANAIASYDNGGSFKPINSKASTQDGLNPSTAIMDEIHAHKDHDLLNVIQSAAGARRNPLFLFTTTEGYETPGPWPELRHFMKQVLQGVIEADHFLCVYYAVDDPDPDAGIEGDDDFDESAWVKANPLMECNPILLREIRKAAIEAKGMPGKLAEFRIKRLNRPSATGGGWIHFAKWRLCGGPLDIEMLRPYPCWGGLDLASTTDLCSFRLVWLVDGVYYTWGRRWVPRAAVAQRTQRGLVPYGGWVASGALELIEGDVIDHDVIEASILEAKERFDIRKIGYDTWNAAQISSKLSAAGLPMEPFIQGPKSYHPAMQAFERAYVAGNFRHGDDPVLNWCASNIVARQDVNLNMAPDKKKSADKIDDMVAMLMAFGVSLVEPEKPASYQLIFV